ncbi:MerR family transcriptional regulator [Actinomadura hibisca]|uniref:MerR family transcriptional regulator n=1 Tax=Actinomadura hibisca TaxID=68565 RepID=UPI0035A224EA
MTIGEAAAALGVEAHVLRHWRTRSSTGSRRSPSCSTPWSADTGTSTTARTARRSCAGLEPHSRWVWRP